MKKRMMAWLAAALVAGFVWLTCAVIQEQRDVPMFRSLLLALFGLTLLWSSLLL